MNTFVLGITPKKRREPQSHMVDITENTMWYFADDEPSRYTSPQAERDRPHFHDTIATSSSTARRSNTDTRTWLVYFSTQRLTVLMGLCTLETKHRERDYFEEPFTTLSKVFSTFSDIS